MANTKKQFLDLSGLQSLWAIINDKFATKSSAVGEVVYTAGADNATLVVKAVDGTQLSTKTIDAATTSVAGLMSASDKTTLDSLKLNSNFKGIALQDGDSSVDIAADQKAVLKLSYDKSAKTISLSDVNGTATTSIDATEFIKDGMLDSAELTTQDGKTVILLTWNTASGKEAMPIDVTSLIDVYNAGNGLSLNGKTFSVKVADNYLTVGANGLAVDASLWTEVDKRDTAIAAAAATDAQSKADAAQAAAISAAAADATSKANAAQAAAISAAATDATSKANAAQAAAEATAAADATSKADKALTDAKSYADTQDASTLAAAKQYTTDEIAKLSYDAAGSAAAAETAAKAYADSLVKDEQGKARFDAAGSAAAAQTAAQSYTDEKVAAIVGEGGTLASTLQAAKDYTDQEVAPLAVKSEVESALALKANASDVTEALKLKADKSSVESSLSSVNGEITTLKTAVNTTLPSAIETAQSNAESYAKSYADGLAKNYDAAGSAAQALVDAKAYTDQALIDADVDGKVATELAKLDLAEVGAAGLVITAVSQTDGKVAATAGQLTDAHIDHLFEAIDVYAALGIEKPQE